MDMDESARSPEQRARQLIARCRQDVDAARQQLEGAWRSLGGVPNALAKRGADNPRINPRHLQASIRQPRPPAKPSPLKLRTARRSVRRMLRDVKPSARPQDRL